RWEFMLLPGEDPARMEAPDTVATLLAPWVTVGRDVEVIRSAVYRFHALIANEWRRGRVLLAGDACHQMPPLLGQGMCSGVPPARTPRVEACVRPRCLGESPLPPPAPARARPARAAHHRIRRRDGGSHLPPRPGRRRRA